MEYVPCAITTDASQRPGGMAANQRLSIVQHRFQGCECPRISQIAQGHGDIAQQASTFGAGDRAATEPGAKVVLGEAEQWHQLGGGEASSWEKGRIGRHGGLTIPRTYRLADIAPENVRPHQGPELVRNGAAQLNGQI
jgi:hypothetical protein